MKFALLPGMSGMLAWKIGMCWHVLAWCLAEWKALWGFMPACQHASRFLNLLVMGGGIQIKEQYTPPK
jgi:hypothetical protein